VAAAGSIVCRAPSDYSATDNDDMFLHCALPDAPAKRVALIQNEPGLGRHMCRPLDRGIDNTINNIHPAFEQTANEAFLPPDLLLCQFSVFEQARHLRAGTCPARRPVVRFSRAEHEVAAVGVRASRWAEQLDMVDFLSIASGDALTYQRISNAPGVVGEPFGIREIELLGMIANEKEPVAAPGNVTCYRADTIDLYSHIFPIPVAWNIGDRNLA